MPTPVPPAYRTRLSVLFAADAAKAVILRRGPKTHFRLIGWDLATGAFTPGQWMKGVVRLCDLSSCGEKLIYWAAQYHKTPRVREARSGPYDPLAAGPRRNLRLTERQKRKLPRYLRSGMHSPLAQPPHDTWTAVSTPPYFTALAIWPAYGTWTGGGSFGPRGEILLWEPEERLVALQTVPLPAGLPILSARALDRRGKAVKPSSYDPRVPENQQQTAIRTMLAASGATWIDWIDARGPDLLFAADGCLYRTKDLDKLPPDELFASAVCLADFREMRFEPVAAPPSALTW